MNTLAPPASLETAPPPEESYDISEMHNDELLEAARDFSTRYHEDETYFPSAEQRTLFKSLADSIEMSTDGPISYSLRGEKLDSTEARGFLDDVIRMEREEAGENYDRAVGIMAPETLKGALDDFQAYTQENAIGTQITRKTAEIIDKTARKVQYLGGVALKTTVLMARTGAKVVVGGGKVAAEASKFAGRQAKKAAKGAHEKAGEAVDVLMAPSEPDPSWLDFVREADAAEAEAAAIQESAEAETQAQSNELSSVSAETRATQEEAKKSGKVRKLGKIALKTAVVAGSAYYLKRRGKHIS